MIAMSSLNQQVTLITGASAGIGRALSLALADRQARLVLAARDPQGLASVADECRQRGAEAFVVPTDVGDQPACGRLIESALGHYGAIDVVVNNAGITMDARFDEVKDPALFERLMRINYLGAVWVTYYALAALKRARGRLAFISSLSAYSGLPHRTGYAPTKAAMIAFADSLRMELAGSGVTVSVIAPDFVRSEIHVRALDANGQAIGASPLQEHKIMTAERCAEEIVQALEHRQRLRLLSLRGRVGYRLRPWFPQLIDWVATRAVRRGK
jgi:NAD(P)-dependent dehydrogenase (short-subunit alcohol dehydrogenase family)